MLHGLKIESHKHESMLLGCFIIQNYTYSDAVKSMPITAYKIATPLYLP